MISVSFWEKMNAAYHDMVDLKVSLGYSALTYTAAHILPFLEYGTAAFPNAEEITKEMLDSWLTVRKFATDNTRKHVIINLRHFTRYLNAVGYTAFVPTEDYNIKIQRYQPYIFTDFELRCLFDEIDDVKPCARSHAELILPVLFRLELCCGMRPNEPLSLRTEDVDLRSGDIFIRKSKRGKDRHIIISEDMRKLCARYDQLAGRHEWFFQHWDGGRFSSTWARNRFNRAWIRSGLSSGKNMPRPYDLRHNFATRVLMRWVDEKRDVMALIPFLSTYMGHVSLEETMYYIHLLPERLKASPGINWDMLGEIYKTEGAFYEEN